MLRINRIIIVLLFLTISLVGCDFAPKLEVPRVSLPSKESFPLSKKGKFKVYWGWWRDFKNPELNRLVELALKNNDDLKIASAKLEEVLALAGLKKAQLFPLIGYKAQVSRTKIPENIENSIEDKANNMFSKIPAPPGASLSTSINIENPKTSYNILLSASYELDLWGKLRNERKSAIAKVLSVKAMQDVVKITLVSGVTTLYFNALALKKQIAEVEQLEKDLKEILEYRKLQNRYGLVSEAEVYQAEANYQEIKKLVESLKEGLEKVKNNLAFLVGMSPKELFEKEIKLKGKLPEKMKLPSMLPSEVLLNRPDIRMAEMQLRSANFDIGVAKAMYFPSIKLTGYWGSLSSEFDELIKSSSFFWSVGAGVSGPIFTFGRIKARVKFAKAKKKEALFNYIKTIRNAFKEVYDAFLAVSYAEKKINIEKKKLSALKKNLQVVKKQYANGLVNKMLVLVTEVGVIKEKLKLIQLQNEFIKNYIYLYKTLGSGILTKNGRKRKK